MSDETKDRLTDEEAKKLIKTIEEVEKEEADEMDAASEAKKSA